MVSEPVADILATSAVEGCRASGGVNDGRVTPCAAAPELKTSDTRATRDARDMLPPANRSCWRKWGSSVAQECEKDDNSVTIQIADNRAQVVVPGKMPAC